MSGTNSIQLPNAFAAVNEHALRIVNMTAEAHLGSTEDLRSKNDLNHDMDIPLIAECFDDVQANDLLLPPLKSPDNATYTKPFRINYVRTNRNNDQTETAGLNRHRLSLISEEATSDSSEPKEVTVESDFSVLAEYFDDVHVNDSELPPPPPPDDTNYTYPFRNDYVKYETDSSSSN